MNIGTCESCRYWQTHRTPPNFHSHQSRCDQLEDSGDVWSEAYEKEGIWTSADFGCSLFEPKDDSAR